TPTPASGQVNSNNPADTGAIYALNLPVPAAGSKYIILLKCLDSATIFRNTSNGLFTYPYTIAESFSITGNYAEATKSNYYYWFYDIKLNLLNCPSPRTAVVAGNVTLPVASLNGGTLSSSVASGNQWFRNGAEIPGATGQTYTPTLSGLYKTVVTAASGCLIASNEINFTSTAVIDVSDNEIALSISPNPNAGVFNLRFEFNTRENLEISVMSASGQRVYTSNTPGFIGKYTKQISLRSPAGLYMVKIKHGNKLFVKKLLIQ
ncbi:MAG: T9SS type A sorting domain-containing protein, partial [Chitinophagaceae bacterium]